MAENEGAEKDLEIGDEQGDEVAGGAMKRRAMEEATLDAAGRKKEALKEL